MDFLPVEVISHILKYLANIKDRKVSSLVCKCWYEAYQDPLFRHLEVLNISEDIRFEVLTELKSDRRFYNLVIDGVEIKDSTLKFWEKFGPEVRSLSIIKCDIREKLFIHILRLCEKIESLSLQNCRDLFMMGHLLEDVDVRLELKNKLVMLNSLNLSYNHYLSDAMFSRFALTFSNLKALLLSGCQISFFSAVFKRFYPKGLIKPSENVLTFTLILSCIKQNAKTLKHLSFNDTYINNAAIFSLSQINDLQLSILHLRGCFQISEVAVKILSNQQTSLTELDLSMCAQITDSSLLNICSNLKMLIKLSVRQCKITDLGISNLRQLEKLKYLDISECVRIEGKGIVQGICHKINPTLRELHISNLENVPEDVFVSLSESLPNLRVLNLGFCYNGVTNKSVQSILKFNLYLHTLILTECKKLTNEGLIGSAIFNSSVNHHHDENYVTLDNTEIEQNIIDEDEIKKSSKTFQNSECSLKNLKGLKYVDLQGCSNLDDSSLINGFGFNELRYLNLNGCFKITEKGLKNLSENNAAIESLHLKNCHNVNERGVTYILKNLKRLRTLVLSSNQITNSIVPIFKQYGGELINLDVTQCNRMTSKDINDILTALPKVQNFLFYDSDSSVLSGARN